MPTLGLSVLKGSVSNWSVKAPSPKVSGEEELSLPKGEEAGGEMPQCCHYFFQSLSFQALQPQTYGIED